MSKKLGKNGPQDLKNVRLLKDEHIKELFGISQSCVYQWRKKKLLPFIKMGSLNFYIEEVILKMLYLRGGNLPDDVEELDE